MSFNQLIVDDGEKSEAVVNAEMLSMYVVE